MVPLDGDVREHRDITPLDDDGFESLNGNGSSENGEEAAEDAEEAGGMQCKVAEDLSTHNRSSLNWKSSVQGSDFCVIGEKQDERNRSSLNYSDQMSEGSMQGVKFSASNVVVPTVQITQHSDIAKLPDEHELTVESDVNIGHLKNGTRSDEAARILDSIECSDTKCAMPEETGDSAKKLVGDSSLEYDQECSQRKKFINEREHVRLSDSSADERHIPFRKFRVQDMSCRSPCADSDTDITDTEIKNRSPQVTHSHYTI